MDHRSRPLELLMTSGEKPSGILRWIHAGSVSAVDPCRKLQPNPTAGKKYPWRLSVFRMGLTSVSSFDPHLQ